MSWKLTYDAPVGLRTNRGFWAVTTFGPDSMWWHHESKTWLKEIVGACGSHHTGPRTTRAFMRYLRNHPELKGQEVVFVNNARYDSTDLNITAIWED